jgi:hypothetical protein
MKGIAASTKEMGPGGRSDTLDDFCGFSNYRKLVGIGQQPVCHSFVVLF